MKILCDIYKTASREEMYLFLARDRGFEAVPEALLNSFGEPQLVTTIVLTEDRKLARADINQVLAELDDRGFYLHMPPSEYPEDNLQGDQNP